MNASVNTLGKYQIVREIARSNDIVWEAVDPELGRRVAIKELNLPEGVTEAQNKSASTASSAKRRRQGV
jgi:hypothetical protein